MTVTTDTPTVAGSQGRRERMPRRKLLGPLKFRAWMFSVILGVALVVPFLAFAIAPDFFAPYGPLELKPADKFLPPSGEYWFGTDALGRDVYSRVVFGSRVSLATAFFTVAIVAIFGTIVGLIAGYSRGWVDGALMRTVDFVLAFPSILLAIGVAAALGPGTLNAMIAIALVWWPVYARLVRGITMTIRNQEFVEAGIAVGGTHLHIIRKHIFPGVFNSVVIRVSLDIGYAILLLAGLGFIGLGERPPYPEWGSMLSANRAYLLNYWWTGVFPAMALTIVILGFSFIGDGLVDNLNPRLRNL